MSNKNQNLIRTSKFLFIFLFIGGILASCSKDKDNEESNISQAEFEKNYFGINEGNFNGRSLPPANSESLEILGIAGNSTVLAGGSNIIHLSSSEEATEVVVGVKDMAGYFTVPMTVDRGGAHRGTLSMTDLRMVIGQQMTETFTIAFSVGDGQGNYSQYEYLVVNRMDAGTGILQVNLVWDQLNDVDLHLIEPDGTKIYYGNSVSENGGQLDVDSNPACYIDGINNENIFYEDNPEVTIPFGEYEVLVDLYANCDIVPNTNYSVVVHYGGVQIAATQGVNPFDGVLTPADESGNSNPISVMKFTIDSAPAPRNSGNSDNALSAPKAYKFTFDKSRKAFEHFSPKK